MMSRKKTGPALLSVQGNNLIRDHITLMWLKSFMFHFSRFDVRSFVQIGMDIAYIEINEVELICD